MLKLIKTDRKTWDKLIKSFPEANFLQSWQYGDVQVAVGHHAERYVISSDNDAVGLMQIVVKNARRGRYMEIAGGPLIDWTNRTLIAELVEALKTLGRHDNCVFVRLRPQCTDSAPLRAIMKSLGCRPSPMHVTADHTAVIDLTRSLDQLLTAMRQQTRYEVRRASRRDISVAAVLSSDFIDEFYQTQAETARRQGFIPPSKHYLCALYDNFPDHITLYRATKNGQLLNLAIVISYGQEVDYLEAASTAAARNEPGAYAIIWQAIADAKLANHTRFNLWGIAPPDSPQHRYAGVTTFKHGFGGDDVAYLAPHDIVVRPLRYQLNHLIESARKRRRHL